MTTIRMLLVSLFILGLSACGGGGGGDSSPATPPDTSTPPPSSPPPTSGIGRTGISVGPVTTFGSIVVNGVRYDTSSTEFSIDGEPGSEDDLRVGDIVIVRGTVNDDGLTGTADSVFYDDIVTGPVESVDVAGNSLVVLGQLVLVRPETSFDDDFSPRSLEGVAVDQIVEVSGVIDADGNIIASRIEDEDPGTEFEVHGFVANLDESSSQFTLGALTVDYAAASLDDFPNGEISDGDFVEAKGSSLGAGGELIATEVEFEDDFLDVDEGDYIEIEGFITRFVSATDFDVAGVPVTTTASTDFEEGSAADLALNVKVEVEGEIDSNGVLVAEDIEIEGDNEIEIEGLVDAVDATAGTVTILGITITVNESTSIEDYSEASIDPLTLGDINVGDYLEIAGREASEGNADVIAGRLERDSDEDESVLKGFVTAISEPTFEILGVTIETNASTEFEDDNFFSEVEVGSLVEVEGTEVADTTIVADEVELESDDD